MKISYTPAAVAAFLAIMGLTFLPTLGSKGALLFLTAGLILGLTRPGEMLAMLRQEWLIMAMALWCLFSFLWSDYPAISLRHGIQLVLTVVIFIAICFRVAPLTFVKIILLSHFLVGLGSLASGRTRADGGGFLGLFGSKNALAAASAILIIVALAVTIDRRLNWYWRLLALLGLVLGSVLLVMGKSAGALVGVIGVILAFGLIVVLQRLAPIVRLVAITLGLVLMMAAGVLLSSMSDELSQAFLDATGKDMTLTGRTDLWMIAFREIAERPLLGAGFQAVWVPGNPLAEQMWMQFGIKSRGGFNFHNSLISNAVEIGLIGAAMQAVIFFTALVSTLSWAIRSPSAASIFFALFMVRQTMSMLIEVAFFTQFSIDSGITVAAVFYAHRYRRATGAVETRRPRAEPRPRDPRLALPIPDS
ncbi:O-antigen ligase family protein [uncultured Paracoccus sp.]|uniref:O-antigen ligase family protein n=1 Tax=uncultured Paracoccus sp. TaxID=189685 RepID=UPI002618696E|nr:O-antigen ligase family protein [uncultured Paracoccus sp.]